MDPYSRFQVLRTFLVISGMTFTFAGGRYFRDQLPAAREAFVEYLVIAIYALIPFVIWAIIVYIVMPIVLERKFFRRLVLGSRYIEGTWIQWNAEQNKKSISILEIQPNKDSFVITGRHYLVENKGVQDIAKKFNTTTIKFEWPVLLYYYRATPPDRIGESRDTQGIGEFNFTAHGEAPTRYDGMYIHGGDWGRVAIEGRKATPEEARILDHNDVRRQQLIRRLAGDPGDLPENPPMGLADVKRG